MADMLRAISMPRNTARAACAVDVTDFCLQIIAITIEYSLHDY